jgi:quinoprotein glucose dehydrogenase
MPPPPKPSPPDNTAPDNMKGEALQDLGDWAKPAQRDVIMGVYRPLPERSPAPAADALRPLIAGLIRQGSDIVKSAAIVAAEQLGLKEAGPAMSELVADTKAGGNVRVAALSALAGLRDPKLSDALKIASTDANTSLRTQANKLLASSGTPEGLSLLGRVLNNAASSLVEKQGALDSLGAFPGAEADKILAQWLDRLLQSKPEVPPGLTLDILMASAKRTSAEVQSRLKKYEDARSKNDELASYREVLTGGDAAEGRKIFYERADAQCLRCHKVKGEGSEVGPDLTEIAKRQPREYLLEALVLPNKVIAQGFESVVIDTKGGDQFAGVFKGETDEAVTLVMSDASVMKVKKTDIQTRRKGLSAMPEGFGQLLSKRDLRNLVEFLASLK